VTGVADRSTSGREVLHFRLHFQDVRPPAADVETVLGYAKDAVPPPVHDGIDGLLASGDELWAIQGGCVVHPARIDTAAGRLVIEGVAFDVEEIVAGQLERSQAAAVFLCTAGPGIGDLSRRLMAEDDPFTAFLADTVGSLVVERAMDVVQDRLEQAMAARGLRITNRYSPGYCGWHVGEQQKLFRLLPAGFCGVSLTESSLMQPIKSVSGVIGIGPDVRRAPYTCRLCDREDCLYRRLQPPAESAPSAR
jgi:cobalamin-dependent methionine synthase-like protein